jgi:hypothetical protein
LYIPNKEVLENEVEKVLREYDKKIKLKKEVILWKKFTS